MMLNQNKQPKKQNEKKWAGDRKIDLKKMVSNKLCGRGQFDTNLPANINDN